MIFNDENHPIQNLVLPCNLTKVMLNNEEKKKLFKISMTLQSFILYHLNDVFIMPGHPQSVHITSSTAKCHLDANSEGPDKQN